MKRIFFSLIVVMTFIVTSSTAQYYDQLVYIKIPKDQIPEVVENAFNLKFNRVEPSTWTKFPFVLEKFGWEYDLGAVGSDLSHFEVEIKSIGNNNYSAVYSNTGELIEATELTVNIRLPSFLMEEFSKSNYNDWEIISTRQIINLYRNAENNSAKVEQNFRIRVEKDGVKRNIDFKWKGSEDFPDYYTNVTRFFNLPVAELVDEE